MEATPETKKYYFTISVAGANRRELLNSAMYVGSLGYLTSAQKTEMWFHHYHYNFYLRRLQIDVVRFSDMQIVHEDEVLKDTGHTVACWQKMHEAHNWAKRFPCFCRTCWSKGYFETSSTREDPGDYGLCGDCLGNDNPKCPRCSHPVSDDFKVRLEAGEDENTFVCGNCGYGSDDQPFMPDLDQCDCYDKLYSDLELVWNPYEHEPDSDGEFYPM